MTRGSRAFVSLTLFAALGLVGAFVVSAIADRRTDDPPEAGLQAMTPDSGDRASVRVEVLNGAGAAGLARDATHALRAHGFDVVYFGNADRFDHPRSFVIDRTGEPEQARDVAAMLGIDSVTTTIDSSLMLEATVILGDDWPPEAAPAPERTWQDRLRELVPGDSTPPG